MKVLGKIVIIILLIVVAFGFISKVKCGEVVNTEFYKPKPTKPEDTEEAGKAIGKILGTIRNVGICIAIVMLTVIGLKYILCSLDEKATYKENMVPYIVGCFLLASATTLPALIYDIMMKN